MTRLAVRADENAAGPIVTEGVTAMHAADAIERIAAIAHDLWRDKMEAQGWVYGPEYDEQAKRHDALVPYAQLDSYDQRRARFLVEAEEMASGLLWPFSYDRGPGRLFAVEEMREGLPVLWRTKDRPPDPTDLGRIVAWDTDEDGYLNSITVEWSDGERSEHVPELRELMRVDGPRA